MNLKVGDILEREPNFFGMMEQIRILGVCGEIVFVKNSLGNLRWTDLETLEQEGWQLKKTEEKNPCYVFNGIACQECTKEKTIVKPKQIYFDLYSDDEYNMVTTTIREYFSTKEQAEAYRSELIERNK